MDGFRNLPDCYIPMYLDHEPHDTGGWLRFLFSRSGDRYPPGPVCSVKSNLRTLRDGDFVWLGHSSLLVKLGGRLICIDPVLSPYASPLSGIIPAWPGSQPFSISDLPDIDFLLISHDHWDHLDYPTVSRIKYSHLLCGKGVGNHFRYWGLDHAGAELDWFEEVQTDGLRIIFTPSIHFSGRGLVRNKTLWGGFLIDAGSGGRIYYTGDGGYGSHFGDISRIYGPLDICFMDCGQYNRNWPQAHMFPEQSVLCAIDTGARLACPVHHGKFTLAWHPWNEPVQRFSKAALARNLPFILPRIGEVAQISSSHDPV